MTIAAFVIWTPFVVIFGGYFAGLFFFGYKGKIDPSANPQAVVAIIVLSLIFFLLAIVWGVYAVLMALRYSVAVPACVVEDLKARKALRRSIDLSKGSRGRIFLLGLLIFVLQMGLVLLAQVFFIVVAVKSHGVMPVWVRVLQQIVGFFTNSFIGPMYAIGLALFYYDLRIRKEGFDIEWMMQAAGLTVPQPVAELPAAAELTPPVKAEEGQA
jgi:uncharacterized membrane protein